MFDAEEPKYALKWLLTRRGKLASNFAETGAHIRTDPTMPAPNFQLLFGAGFFFEHGARHLGRAGGGDRAVVHRAAQPRHRPDQVRGPGRKPAVVLNMLSEPSELDEMIDAVERAREIAADRPGARSARRRDHPGPTSARARRSPPGSARRASTPITRRAAPGSARPRTASSIFELRVHGVERLRIADSR